MQADRSPRAIETQGLEFRILDLEFNSAAGSAASYQLRIPPCQAKSQGSASVLEFKREFRSVGIMKICMTVCGVLAWLLHPIGAGSVFAQHVGLEHLPDQEEVRIQVDGRLFTVYRHGEGFSSKPVFYPVLTSDERMVNRGFPMEAIPGEPTDHPHQKSLFFAYGDVNGVDFWNEQEGSAIAHREIARMEGGREGLLEVLLDWVMPDGEVVLDETRIVRFGAGEKVRWIDQESVLTARGREVVLGDSKEGLFAIRVAASLQEAGGSGRYEDAFGRETESEVWGRRSPWMALRGEVEGSPVTLAIFEHPSSAQHPGRWHARGYGLFSANPLGRKEFDADAEPLNHRLEPGESLRFRYRLVVYEGSTDRERLNRDYKAFAANSID